MKLVHASAKHASQASLNGPLDHLSLACCSRQGQAQSGPLLAEQSANSVRTSLEQAAFELDLDRGQHIRDKCFLHGTGLIMAILHFPGNPNTAPYILCSL